MRIGVIGLGRIGGQILRELSAKYDTVLGVDLDPARVESMRSEGCEATVEIGQAAGLDVYLIAVSTGPRMENLRAAASGIDPAQGALISVESTIIPGTMAQLAEDFARRGMIAGERIHLVHAPHRILFGEDKSIFGQPRVIGGITPACLARGASFYRDLVPGIQLCDDVRLVELTKLVENALRHLEIASAEALALYCHEAGLDFEALRALVGSKGNVRLLRAEYGIGGECLTKDATFLHEVTGCSLWADALAIDEEYRSWLVRQSMAPRVLVRGITFKPNWRDLGYSRAIELVKKLQSAGSEVWVEDPLYTPEELEQLGFKAWRPGAAAIDRVVTWGKVSKGGSEDG